MAMVKEGGTMMNELQWEGFAAVADSGVREALYAAGVDCALCACHEPEGIAPDQDRHDRPTP